MFLFFHGSSDVIYQKGVQNVYHSNDVDDFIGAKIKTPKNPWTKNLPPPPAKKKKKNSIQNYAAVVCGHHHESSVK